MKRSIAAMVAVICVSMSTFVFADELGAEKFAGGHEAGYERPVSDLNAQKTDLTNDLKAKERVSEKRGEGEAGGRPKRRKSKPRLT